MFRFVPKPYMYISTFWEVLFSSVELGQHFQLIPIPSLLISLLYLPLFLPSSHFSFTIFSFPLSPISYSGQEQLEKRKAHIKDTCCQNKVHIFCQITCQYNMCTLCLCIVFALSVVASTGRVGNVLVALRCVEIRDKAISMAFQVSMFYKDTSPGPISMALKNLAELLNFKHDIAASATRLMVNQCSFYTPFSYET